MNRIPVNSEMIESIGYDTISETLELAFIEGQIYQYIEVPENVFMKLMYAESKSEFFNSYVKERYPVLL